MLRKKRELMKVLMEELDSIFKNGDIRDNFGRIATLSEELDKLSSEIKELGEDK